MIVADKMANALSAALMSPGRSPLIPEREDAYGWLVGSWEFDVMYYWGRNVSAQRLKGEAHFAWVLEGRAIQDVWIMPRQSERQPSPDKTLNMYGTTLRAWDPTIQGWRITWTNPAGDHHETQIGRWHGSDVVQMGLRPDGTTTQWSFREITPDSFHWLGESRRGTRGHWTLEGEFHARRLPREA